MAVDNTAGDGGLSRKNNLLGGKHMGLFISREEEEKLRVQRFLEAHDLQDISDPKDSARVKRLVNEFINNYRGVCSEISNLITQTNYIHAIMEQNFIIIGQLDRIAKLLEEK